MATQVLCAVDGCGKKVNSRGYCGAHAYKFRTYGDPLGGRRGASPGAPLKWIADHASYDGDDCIKWPFEIGRYGYGTVKDNGKKRVASRVMCERVHGAAPTDKHDAAHSCGNGTSGCMNPKHLRWATRKENMADNVRMGRTNKGMKAFGAKLTDSDIQEIYRLSGKLSHRKIGEKFGVRGPHVWRILNGYVRRDQWLLSPLAAKLMNG